ncbi:MAG TPA: hypothetical protein VFY28_00950 [Candidatus Paceibacterota bacterium]|nr:hypothetical protein [Candidatus Paceibacterota bacterium]
MPVFRALGLGIAIIVLRFLVPAIFNELEATIIAFLSAARTSLDAASGLAASVGNTSSVPLFLPPSGTPPFPLPTAPLYNP